MWEFIQKSSTSEANELQTLNFVKSLPKRERKPMTQVISRANADGKRVWQNTKI